VEKAKKVGGVLLKLFLLEMHWTIAKHDVLIQ